MMQLIITIFTISISAIILKHTNLQNFLISGQYRYFLIPKTKMYDCVFCLQAHLGIVIYLFIRFLLI